MEPIMVVATDREARARQEGLNAPARLASGVLEIAKEEAKLADPATVLSLLAIRTVQANRDILRRSTVLSSILGEPSDKKGVVTAGERVIAAALVHRIGWITPGLMEQMEKAIAGKEFTDRYQTILCRRDYSSAFTDQRPVTLEKLGKEVGGKTQSTITREMVRQLGIRARSKLADLSCLRVGTYLGEARFDSLGVSLLMEATSPEDLDPGEPPAELWQTMKRLHEETAGNPQLGESLSLVGISKGHMVSFMERVVGPLVGVKEWEFAGKTTGILESLARQESWQPVPTAFVTVEKAAQMVIESSTLLVLARRGDQITQEMFEGGVRVFNALGRSGIKTLSSLAALSLESLLAVRDLRLGGLKEILPVLREMGGSTEAANLAGEIEAYLDTHHPCEATPEKRARELLLRVTQEETIMVSGSLRPFFQRAGIGSSEIHRILSLQGYEQREEVFKILAQKAQALIEGGDLTGEMAKIAQLRFMERKPVGQIAVELGKEIRDISPILKEIRERIRKSLGMV